jgi:hypothetical protein
VEIRLRIFFRAARSACWALLVLALAAPALAEDDADSKINPSVELARANKLASAGAVTRSIPHYEKVIEAAPEQYNQAHFNLAEVYRFKKECSKAVLLYNAYMSFEKEDTNRADARKGIAACTNGQKTGTLSVAVSPEADSQVRVDGYVLSRGGGVDKIALFPGDYTVEVQATDHKSKTDKITIEEGADASRSVELEKKLFYGTLRIEVDQKDATIKIEPKDLDSPKAKSESVTMTSPLEKPPELATGKYFIEVTKPGFERWIRNVQIERDQEADVQVRLTGALPEAIRPE